MGDAMPIALTRAKYKVYQTDFLAFDKDENGSLNDDEVCLFIRKQLEIAGTEASDDAIKALQAEFDKNGDGKIELDEYITKMEGGEWELSDGKSNEKAAKKAVTALDKHTLGELKTLPNPPEGVKKCGICCYTGQNGKTGEWKDFVRMIADSKFLKNLKAAPFEPYSPEVKEMMKPYMDDPELEPAELAKKNKACELLMKYMKERYAIEA